MNLYLNTKIYIKIIVNMEEKFYPLINEAQEINEIYADPDYLFFKADDIVPTFAKKNFRDIVREIQRTLARENFSELQIEDYIKRLVEEIVE